MDLSKLNPIEWIKDLIQTINKLPIGILISLFIILTLLTTIPQKYIAKVYLLDFMPWLSIINLFVIILIIGRVIQFIINKMESFVKNKQYEIELEKQIERLSTQEKELLKNAVISNTTSIQIEDAYNNSAQALVGKGFISQPMGGGGYGYTCIILDLAWPIVKKYFTQD